MPEPLNVIRGTNDKPAATSLLIEDLIEGEITGDLFIGYPVISSPDGHYAVDAILVSPAIGVVCFHLVEGPHTDDYIATQDDIFNKLYAKLLGHRELIQHRTLQIPIQTITYAPAISEPPIDFEYPIKNRTDLISHLQEATWATATQELYRSTLSAIQSISAIRRSGAPRKATAPNNRAGILQSIEDSISTLDPRQSKAVIETVEGVQRIRGLAGSGKTIVLALKAAYLHAQHPDWNIAVTFNTRSLKSHFLRHINVFSIEQTGAEPDWDKLQVINSWGAPGGAERDGIYHQFCKRHGIEYLDFGAARREFGFDNAFEGVVTRALAQVPSPTPLFDAILVDEAQDFTPTFLKLCFQILEPPKRLVYAYDELQNLNNAGLPSPEEIFGTGSDGKPLVELQKSSRGTSTADIILEKCYRNSRPVLVSAHGLGFGIYRNKPSDVSTGIVQMFGQPELWNDIGYQLEKGNLALGSEVTLARSSDTSPTFLEDHSPIDDLVMFRKFDSQAEQAEWIAAEIHENLNQGELRHSDIIVINTDPGSARSNLGIVRKALLSRQIRSHIAGVDTKPDIFYEEESITCTGIHRAKGNEAAMVYVINADECHSSAANLARVRNRLFTAITRSKAWVRITGVGSSMESLMQEYQTLRDRDFALTFRYPTQEELDKLKVIHRDVSPTEQKAISKHQQAVSELLQELRQGKLFVEDIDEQDLETLRDYLA